MKTQPNILFFFPDQWRWDWMSYNAHLDLRTPNIDRLIRGGVTFNRCYTSSPLCAPARACLASGRDFDHCPAPSNQDDYDLSVPTFYQRMRDARYRVAGVGKFDLHKGLAKPLDWHLDGSRLLDEWGFTDGIDNEGKLDGSASYRRQGGPKGPYMNFLHKQGVADSYVQEHAGAGKFNGSYVTKLSDEQYCDNWLSENGLRIIDSFPKNQPYFMQVNFTGPHDPFDVTERMHDLVKDRTFPPPNNNQQELTAEDHQRKRRHYAAMIENIDRQIGRFIDLVEQRNELENTLFVFSSDHGEMLGDHNRGGKGTWHEGSIHVPLVVSGPGVKRGITSDCLTVLHDLTGTFVEAASAEKLEGSDSRELWPVLRGAMSTHRDHVLTGLGDWRCVVGESHKFVTGFPDTPDTLVDLSGDPLERVNVAREEAEVVQKLRKLIP